MEQFDENSVCANTLRKLSSSKEAATGQFLLHEWLYEKREIKSNLELTKSLKLIQPLLYDTVQKKHITSNMWESFQGPLTWQHFCRLAFRDTSSKQTVTLHHQTSLNAGVGSVGGTGSHSAANIQNQTNQNQTCYEPEPIPALLVSSADKDWLTISPYAIKFWDKLNLEPYSKSKNIAYVVLMPDFSANPSDASSDLPPELDECEVVRDYFKELSSTYELCRLGLHRPALRVAADHGFVRVPLSFDKPASSSKSKVKVDPWFTQIQANK